MKKTTLALAVALMMCLTLVPFSASAAGETVTLEMESFTFGSSGDLAGAGISVFEISNVTGRRDSVMVGVLRFGEETETVWDELTEEWYESSLPVLVDFEIPHYMTAGATTVTIKENNTTIGYFIISVGLSGRWELYATSYDTSFASGTDVRWDESVLQPALVTSLWSIPDGAGFTIYPPGLYRVQGMAMTGETMTDFFISIEGSDDETDSPAPPPDENTVSATAATVLVDGETTDFEAYNIDGYNFFKLRDLAYALNGSSKQFSVGWDGDANAISLASGEPYEAVGGEMEQGDGTDKAASPTTSTVFLDGEELSLTAYNIGGNNFFRLRDLMSALDVGVTWDDETSTIGLDTSIPYSE